MTKEEFDAWKKWCKSSRRKWIIDPIHNGRNGKDVLAHIGGDSGKYVSIDPSGFMMLGSYTDATPHIGEALFKEEGRKHYSNFFEAVEKAVAAGLGFLEELLPGKEMPQEEKDLERCLKNHDWWYVMSDDHRSWQYGAANLDRIENLCRVVQKEVAQRLWDKHAPEGFPFPAR
jgi:hypothetical protein